MLTTDGDTRFDARGVSLLRDEILRDETVGGVCGRIKPTGSMGTMLWFQKFEYASGHWLQKVAEHVLGSVLCCPGCFSMYRLSALTEVVEEYEGLAKSALEYLQMDQGEDRWMCLLLIEKGRALRYCAEAVGSTEAPDNLTVFFEQRRRWIVSTMANILELVTKKGLTIARKFANINLLFLFYIGLSFATSIVGPATVVLLGATAMNGLFEWSLFWSLVFSLMPPALFIGLVLWQSIPNPRNKFYLFRGENET